MHSQPNPLKFRYFRSVGITFAALLLISPFDAARSAEPLPCTEHFNPANGFKPAQRNLTAIFLQMAGSLEHFGTPEPYMRHVLAEHVRIDARYKKAIGKGGSSRPAYLTADYVEKLLKEWNQMAPVLALESLTRQSGRNMRLAIMGSWNMPIAEMVAVETKLTPPESTTYRKLLERDWFEKRDFQALDAFYGSGHDKLSELGKSQMSKRVWRGQQTPEKRAEAIASDKGGTLIVTILNAHQKATLAHLEDKSRPKVTSDDLKATLVNRLRLTDESVDTAGLDESAADALFYSNAIRAMIFKRFAHVQKQAKSPKDVEAIRKALFLMLENLIVVAQSEYEAALYSDLADRQ